MRYIRFLSKRELDKLLEGKTLLNYTNHNMQGGRTDSVGFCFFDTSEPAEDRMEYLSGIVSMEAVIEIETDMKMKKGIGMYADPDARPTLAELLSGVTYGIKQKKEYSATKYSLDTVQLIRIGTPKLWPHRIEWKEAN